MGIGKSQIELLPFIYEAAISDERWTRALDLAVQSVSARGAFLSAYDKALMPFNLNHASQIYVENTAITPFYIANFSHYDLEAMQYISTKPPQSLCLDTDIWGALEKLQHRPDFIWAIDNMGLFRRVGTRLNSNKAWSDSIFFQFDKTMTHIPNSSLQQIESLLPHLAKTVEMSRFFGILQHRFNAALAALDRVKIGVIILEPNGHAVVLNKEAQRIIDMMDGLHIADGRLKCRSEEETRKLHAHIAKIAATAIGNDEVAEETMTITHFSDKKPLLVELSPLRDSKKELESGFSGVMATIIDPSNRHILSTKNVGQLYGLTTTELGVCDLLINGYTQMEIADVRNVSPETIKTHIRHIYQKTQTSRRADLIRLVVDINPPIERGN